MQLEEIERLSKQPLLSDSAVQEHFLTGLGAILKESGKETPNRSVNDAELDRLAKLSPLEYDRVRRDTAKRLGIRTETLDQEIEQRRPHTEDEATPGSPLTLPDIEPWPESVDGQGLLADLVAMICRMEERPWSDWKKGKPINPNHLAGVLRAFEVGSRTLRLDGNDRAKGYKRTDFADAFSRYLPELALSKRDNVTTHSSSGDEPLLQSVTPPPCHGSENARNPVPEVHCHAVTDRNPILQGGEEVIDLC